MATGKSLGELEYTWFADRTTTSNKISDMKREYFGSKVGKADDAINISVEELERRWLVSVSGLAESQQVPALWAGACAAQSAPVSKFVDENKRNFYATVAGTP